MPPVSAEPPIDAGARPVRSVRPWEAALVGLLVAGMLATAILYVVVRGRSIRAHHAQLREIRLGMSRDEVTMRLGPAWRTEACRELPEWLNEIQVLARADAELTECVGWRTTLDLTFVRVVCFDRQGRVVLVAAEST